MSFKYKLVVVVRKDVDLSPGKLAVQVAHASVACAVESKESGDYFDRWFNEGQKKVVVKCDDLEHMDFLQQRAEKEELVTKVVQDAGLTEVVPGTKTCLGIGPGPNEKVDKITGDLSLF